MLNKEQTDFLLVNAYNAAVRAGAASSISIRATRITAST